MQNLGIPHNSFLKKIKRIAYNKIIKAQWTTLFQFHPCLISNAGQTCITINSNSESYIIQRVILNIRVEYLWHLLVNRINLQNCNLLQRQRKRDVSPPFSYKITLAFKV